MPVGQIFLSYSRVDGTFALKLGEDLRKAGIDIWIDQLDIRPSEPWDEEIEKALQDSYCLLVILSDTSVASDNVLNEINYALESKKRVLPILLESNIKKPFNIGRLQHIDFTGSYEHGFRMLLKALSLENAAPVINKPSDRRSGRTPLVIALVVLVLTLTVLYLSGGLLKADKTHHVKDVPASVNGSWSTIELTNPFDEHDKYTIRFQLETNGPAVFGYVNMRSTVDYKGYNVKKDLLEGRVKDSILSFYTVEQSFMGAETIHYKNFYHGTISEDEIRFTLQSDRPMGFPGQRFVAKRMQN